MPVKDITGVVGCQHLDVLGHKPKTMTEGYTHATPEAMVEAVEMLAGYGRTERNYGRITAARA